jgi:hypothetical protein
LLDAALRETNLLEDVKPITAEVHASVLDSGPVPGEVETRILTDLQEIHGYIVKKLKSRFGSYQCV